MSGKRYNYIDIRWHWPLQYWSWEWNQIRFNSGNPYTGYHIGPLFIRCFHGRGQIKLNAIEDNNDKSKEKN